jgi:EpsI family protein
MKPSPRLLVSVTLLLGAFLVMQLRSSGEPVPVLKPLDGFPVTVGPWQGREGVMLQADELNVLKVKDYVVRRYADPSGQNLWLYIGYWDSQRKGAQIHSPRNCLPGAGWEPLEASMVTINLPPPYGTIVVNRFLIQKEQDQQIAFYWYQSQGRATAGEVAARVLLVKNSTFRNRTDGALVRITAPIRGSVSETSARLVDYIRAMYPALHEYLPD